MSKKTPFGGYIPMLWRFLILMVGVMLCFMITVSPAYAKPFPFALPWLDEIDLTSVQSELMEQLQAEYVPKIEKILFPEQREQFEAAIADGHSLRKAFKAMALTPDQKVELASTLKSFPSQNLFAALTPEQKKEIFMKKKEMFKPTPEEIAEKIKAGMTTQEITNPDELSSEFAPTVEEIAGKIRLGMEKKKEFMPSLEEIQSKITEKMASMAGKEE